MTTDIDWPFHLLVPEKAPLPRRFALDVCPVLAPLTQLGRVTMIRWKNKTWALAKVIMLRADDEKRVSGQQRAEVGAGRTRRSHPNQTTKRVKLSIDKMIGEEEKKRQKWKEWNIYEQTNTKVNAAETVKCKINQVSGRKMFSLSWPRPPQPQHTKRQRKVKHPKWTIQADI